MLLRIQILFCPYSYNLWRFTDLIIRFSNGQNLENVQRKLFEIRSKQRASLDDHLGVEPVTRACHCIHTGVCDETDQIHSFQQHYTGVSSKAHGRASGTNQAVQFRRLQRVWLWFYSGVGLNKFRINGRCQNQIWNSWNQIFRYFISSIFSSDICLVSRRFYGLRRSSWLCFSCSTQL